MILTLSAASANLCASARNKKVAGFAQRRRESRGRRDVWSRERRVSMGEATVKDATKLAKLGLHVKRVAY
jgi:hypothetical protein